MSKTPDSFRQREYAGERDLDELWKELRPKREPMQKRFFLPAIVGLLILSIPWYHTPGTTGTLIGGLPTWVWVSLGCSAAIAAVTAVMALRYWDDDIE